MCKSTNGCTGCCLSEDFSNGKRLLDPRTKVTLTFELHEVIGASRLYEEAPTDTDLTWQGADYSFSLDSFMLKLATEVAKLSKDKELLLRGAALRARFDQFEAGS